MLIEEEAVPHSLLLVLHVGAEHADALHSLLLILLMLTEKRAKLILEEAVPHRLLLVLHVMADHADVDVDVVLMNGLLLMRHMLTTKLVVPHSMLLVPHSLLLVLQMLRANASSQQHSSKGRGC